MRVKGWPPFPVKDNVSGVLAVLAEGAGRLARDVTAQVPLALGVGREERVESSGLAVVSGRDQCASGAALTVAGARAELDPRQVGLECHTGVGLV
jgi:hypothetical protein